MTRTLASLALVSLLAAGACDRAKLRLSAEDAGAAMPPGAVPVVPAPEPPRPVPAPAPPPAAPPPAAAPAPMAAGNGGTTCAPFSFATLAKTADPGVVTIVSSIEERRPNGRQRVVGQGLGTGFVYDRAGLILTNNHVVEDGNAVSVKLADGRALPARVVGKDKHTDVAVVKVDATDLTPLPLGDSDALDVGDWVVAIGNPFGLSHTVSAGILSARGRTREDVHGLDPSGYYSFLQTDAAINQGNSGGPLIDLKGQVVGINSAIRANANNIGFAIPINMVKQLLPILVRDGRITRSALGVVVAALDDAAATRFHRPDRKGALITAVVAGGGADRAGLAADDVVLSFDGKTIENPNELRWFASLAGVGRGVTVRVQRGERVFDGKVTLGALPEEPSEDDEPGGFGIPGHP